MKKILCIVLMIALLLLSGCSFFEYRAKHALYHYKSYPDDAAFVTAALDDLNATSQEGTEAYTTLLNAYGSNRVMKEGVLDELEKVFLDEEADLIRRIDAYNLLNLCSPYNDHSDYWITVLDEPIFLPEDVVDGSVDGEEDGDPLRYFCVFWHHWDKERYGLPLTPYTTLSVLRGIPRNQLASSVDQADRFFLCDVTYTMTQQYSMGGSGNATTEGYATYVVIQLHNCHSTATSVIDQCTFTPPASFEAFAAPLYKFGEIRYSTIAYSITSYFENMA